MRNRRTFTVSKDSNQSSFDGRLEDFVQFFKDEDFEESKVTFKIELLKKLLNKIKSTYSKSKSSKAIFSTPNEKQKFEESLFKNLQPLSIILIHCLIQSCSNLFRTYAIRIIIYLSHLEKFNEQFQALGIQRYIIRLIDLDLSNDETSLSIEYIRLISQLYPQYLTESYFYCILSSMEDSKFVLNNYFVETLLELTCKRPEIACQCQVFNELIIYIANYGNENEFCIEVIIQTLLNLLDKPNYRSMIKFRDLYSTLIAPFVDSEYVPYLYGIEFSIHKTNEPINDTNNKSERLRTNNISVDKPDFDEPKIESILSACSCALNSILNHFVGITTFTIDDSILLKNFLSPLSWLLNSNKKNLNITQLIQPTDIKSKRPTMLEIINRQLLVINHLISFLYKLFKIEEIEAKVLADKSNRTSSFTSSYKSNIESSLDEDFVISDCDTLFNSFKSESIDLNTNESTNYNCPNLTICKRALLIKAFVEADLFERLLDLYFGLPISFLQNNAATTRTYSDNLQLKELYFSYQQLSFRCLHLFAELFYLTNNLLNDEYCIDNFNDLNKHHTKEFTEIKSKGIYDEKKKISLLTYLNKLEDTERENELIIFLSEFKRGKENVKNGSLIPNNILSKFNFYTNQFLANSGYLRSKKFFIEMEILSLANGGSFLNENLSLPKYPIDLDKRFEEQIDATLVLSIDSNIVIYDSKYLNVPMARENIVQQPQHWNWFEIVKLFEKFLLISSSLYTQFRPTYDTLTLDHYNKFHENQKLLRLLKKLFEFFIPNTNPSLPGNRIQRQYSTRSASFSFSSYTNPNANTINQISCVGIYLIDFVLTRLNIDKLKDFNLNRPDLNLSLYEFQITHFMQNLKLNLTTEFFPNPNSANKRNNSMDSAQSRNISKDSTIFFYVLIMGHLSSSDKGNNLMELFKLYELVVKIIEQTKDFTFMKLVVSSFNYYKSVKSRSILVKCLCSTLNNRELLTSHNELKIYILRLILNIFKANPYKFEVFFVEIILNSLLDNQLLKPLSEDIARFEFDNSDKIVLELSVNLIEYFLTLRPDFVDSFFETNLWNTDQIELLKKLIVHQDVLKFSFRNYKLIKTKIKLLLVRFLTSKKSLEALSADELNKLIDEWDNDRMDFKYFELIERQIFDLNAINQYFIEEFDDRIVNFSNDDMSLETFTEQDEKKYSSEKCVKLYRKINDPNKNLSDLAFKGQFYIPIHLNSVVVKTELNFSEKFENKIVEQIRIIKTNAIDDRLYSIDNECKIGSKDLRSLKSAIWSLSSICSSDKGFTILSKINLKHKIFINLYEFVTYLIKITEDYPVLSIRGTGFYCLNQLSNTSTGADLIGKLGWTTFQSCKSIESKPFNSVLSLFAEDQKNVYSSIDTAFIFYNSVRSKNRLKLKLIKKYYNYDLATYQKEFLNEQNSIDLYSKDDASFLKSGEDMLSFYFNISLPVRIYLLTADSFYIPNKSIIIDRPKCQNQNCLNYYFGNECDNDDNIKLRILNFINQLAPLTINEAKFNLGKLMKQYPNKFDLCLHGIVSNSVLSRFKIRFQIRKLIQELFFDVSLKFLLDNV